jgi:hypothetical protein
MKADVVPPVLKYARLTAFISMQKFNVVLSSQKEILKKAKLMHRADIAAHFYLRHEDYLSVNQLTS